MENEDTTELASSSINEARWYNTENSVVIKESFFSTDSAVFPPINHEDWPIDSLNQREMVGGQSQVFPSSDSGNRNHEAGEGKVEKKDGRWVGFWSSTVGKIVLGTTECSVFRARIWWFASAVVAVLLFRKAKRWRRRKVEPESKDHLMLLIKSKDQKINELLVQAAQLNEMLLARRRVPILRVD